MNEILNTVVHWTREFFLAPPARRSFGICGTASVDAGAPPPGRGCTLPAPGPFARAQSVGLGEAGAIINYADAALQYEAAAQQGNRPGEAFYNAGNA